MRSPLNNTLCFRSSFHSTLCAHWAYWRRPWGNLKESTSTTHSHSHSDGFYDNVLLRSLYYFLFLLRSYYFRLLWLVIRWLVVKSEKHNIDIIYLEWRIWAPSCSPVVLHKKSCAFQSKQKTKRNNNNNKKLLPRDRCTRSRRTEKNDAKFTHTHTLTRRTPNDRNRILSSHR